MERQVATIDAGTNAVGFAELASADFVFGELRWLEGPALGLRQTIIADEAGMLVLDSSIPAGVREGTRVQLREGCDRTIATQKRPKVHNLVALTRPLVFHPILLRVNYP